MERSMGLYSTSSGNSDSLSVEKGVLRSGSGRRWSRCLEIRLRRSLVNLDAIRLRRAAGYFSRERGLEQFPRVTLESSGIAAEWIGRDTDWNSMICSFGL